MAAATPRLPLNQTTRHWHTGSAGKYTVPVYSGRDVYESHVD